MLDMVRIFIEDKKLLHEHYGEAVNMTPYILNQDPSKSWMETPHINFE